MKLEQCVLENLAPSEYYGIGLDQAVSYSSVSAFAAEPTPRHFYARIVDKKAPQRAFSPALYHGTLFHALCELGEAAFFARYFVMPKDVRKGSSEYLRLLASNSGKKPVKELDITPIIEMYRNLARTKTFEAISKNAKHEVSIFWKYNGHFMKGRADVLLPGLIIDFKTTKNANPFDPQGFQSSITQYRYNAQAAFYTWGMKQLTGIDHRFAIAAVEKDYPYECAFFEIPKQQIAEGMDLIRPHLDRLIHCIKTGDWGDGYGDVFHGPESIGKIPTVNINSMIERMSVA